MSKKIRLIKKRRVCKRPGCDKVLSIYNLDSYCHAHQQFAFAEKQPVRELVKR